jgi:hypothetical protein
VLLFQERKYWKCGLIAGIFEGYNFQDKSFHHFLLHSGGWLDSVICPMKTRLGGPGSEKESFIFFLMGQKLGVFGRQGGCVV